MHSYAPAYLRNGRIVAPLDPFITQIAQKIALNGKTLMVSRGDHFAQLQLAMRPVPAQWPHTYVPIVQLLRTLGLSVAYDAPARRLEIVVPSPAIVSPTPFNPAVPLASPAPVFTPIATPTPRPAVTGRPGPRRTPLPSLCCPH